MGLDLNTALISDTFDGLIKTTDGNVLTSSPLVITDGRGNDSSLALATAGNGVAITGTLTVNGSDISGGLATAQADITAIEAKTDFITVTGAVNLDTINTKAGFITVTQAVDLDTIESDIAAATAKTQYITVTQAVDLDTMESDILSAKTKTDYITISQVVNLDTVESGLATAQSDITAIEAKTDFITVSSNVNLNTIASDASAAKTKTDFLTVTQSVDLDTLESDVNVAKGDITAIEAKTDNITVTQAVNLDTMESDIADAKTKTDFITITQAVNLDTVESGLAQAQTDINQIEAKTNNITVTQAVNLDTMESDIATNNAKNSYPAGDATKVGFISVTQAVDLDSMETDISNLSSNKYDKTGGTISGSVVVTGDLTVNGTTTTVNTQTLSVEDPLIELANQNSANTVDTGFYANYSLDAGVTTKYAGLFKDASDSDKFKLFKGLEVEPTSSVDTAGTGYAKGDLVIGNLEADNLTGTVTATSVLADGVTATTQSAGDNSTKVATTAYVDSIVTAQDLDFAGDSGTGAVDLDSQSLTIAGTANEIETSASGQTVTIGLPSSVTVGTLNATTLGGTLSTAAQTNITSVGTLSSLAVSGNLTVDTNTLYVDATNNRVGIGTSTPSASLDIEGSLPIIHLEDNVGSTNRIYNDNGILGFDADQNQGVAGSAITFAVDASERMRIDSSGNIIYNLPSISGTRDIQFPQFNASNAKTIIRATGTSDYRQHLDILMNTAQADVAPTTVVRIDNGGNVTIRDGKKLILNRPDNAIDSELSTNAAGTLILNSRNGEGFDFQNGGTGAMRIDSSGNVGIGTSSIGANSALLVNKNTGYLSVLSNVGFGGSNNPSYDNGIHFGWNRSNGDGESNIVWGKPSGLSGYLSFASWDGTTYSEKMRITSGGAFKASTDGSYLNAAAVYHELRQTNNGQRIVYLTNTSTTNPEGLEMRYTASSPNSTGNNFINLVDSTTTRFAVRSNGGVANYQANDANLSDERVKKDIAPLNSYWDKFKALELVTFKYKDQTHEDDNIGLIAQQVESVAPEFVSNEGFGETPEGEEPLKTIYTADLYHAAIKVLQEAMAKIETLEAEVETLKSQLNA